MRKAKKLVVGNWKMNPQSTDEAKKIANETKRGLRQIKKTQVVICPPFVYLSSVSNFSKSPFYIGAQDAFYETLGSFTGEVSYSELPDLKVDFVIVGHSERRSRGETDEVINKKVKSVVNSGMTAILCLGEKVRDSQGEYLDFVRRQVVEGLRDVSKKSLGLIVVAYEPVWAIGGKVAMSPRDIQEMSIFIKKILRDMFGTTSDDARVLYGGAVDKNNAKEIVLGGSVSGLLIGRESLKPKDFVQIIKLIEEI